MGCCRSSYIVVLFKQKYMKYHRCVVCMTYGRCVCHMTGVSIHSKPMSRVHHAWSAYLYIRITDAHMMRVWQPCFQLCFIASSQSLPLTQTHPHTSTDLPIFFYSQFRICKEMKKWGPFSELGWINLLINRKFTWNMVGGWEHKCAHVYANSNCKRSDVGLGDHVTWHSNLKVTFCQVLQWEWTILIFGCTMTIANNEQFFKLFKIIMSILKWCH
jgi:hypothetical protein